MSKKKRIVLIHATRVAMEPIEFAFAELWPETEVFSVLDEGLSKDLAQKRVSSEELNSRIMDLANYAKKLAPDAILYTCSSFGEGIESVASVLEIPVLKPNEAMFDEALKTNSNVVMIYSFAPAILGMEQEFRDEAMRRCSKATLRSVFVEEALDALKSGDVQTHNSLVARTAASITNAEVILLAHFSMSVALKEVQAVTSIPVLTSPHAAVEKLKNCFKIKNTKVEN